MRFKETYEGWHAGELIQMEAARLLGMCDRSFRRYLARYEECTDPREALAALRADPAGFDLVVTDCNMPGMSGLDVAREVREIRADLPVAAASGFIDEELRVQASAAGCGN